MANEVPFKTQFWLDNESGTLTDYSSQIQNITGPTLSKTLITPTGINDNDVQAQQLGLRDATITLTGWLINTSVSSLYYNLRSYWVTSVEGTKSWQKLQASLIPSPYEYGECVLESLDPPPGDNAGTGLMFTATLHVDNGVNRTSVSAA